ncbi:putative membrane protein YgcG [Natronocella acetinitrilica]|uniref:Membrane protein YgcG n=1 Tax=Natronocella acetinitrilica TaxID=414046 RepID=A0AAE3KAH4_9GAMM|nr:putative Ig domain-containing protein [Natronocella acetinitrilica]MCP1674315.1 putative membrane protein YgcG [Natronocella acetinitrilica]
MAGIRWRQHALAVALLAAPLGASAITWDINRTEADTIVRNTTDHPFGSIVRVLTEAITLPNGDRVVYACTGTPIGDRLILYAAHCPKPGMRRSTMELPLEGKERLVIHGNVYPAPGYDLSVNPWEQRHVPDIALLHLDQPLPPEIKRFTIGDISFNPHGLMIDQVGYGRSGTGQTGAARDASSTVKRHARNEIDRVEAEGNYLASDFDGGRLLPYQYCLRTCGDPGDPGPGSTLGTNVLGSPGLGPWEGTVGRGDSGGPALFNPSTALAYGLQHWEEDVPIYVKLVPNEYVIVGVTSYAYRPVSGPWSSYGSLTYHANPYVLLDWIRTFDGGVQASAVINTVERAQAPPPEGDFMPVNLPEPVAPTEDAAPDPVLASSVQELAAPRLSHPLQDQAVAVGETLEWHLPKDRFESPSALTFRASLYPDEPLPHWMAFDPQSATLHGVPGHDSDERYWVRITATDSNEAEGIAVFALNVSGQDPSLIGPPDNGAPAGPSPPDSEADDSVAGGDGDGGASGSAGSGSSSSGGSSGGGCSGSIASRHDPLAPVVALLLGLALVRQRAARKSD